MTKQHKLKLTVFFHVFFFFSFLTVSTGFAELTVSPENQWIEDGNSYWDIPLLKTYCFVDSNLTFVVEKIDGSDFNTDGTLSLRRDSQNGSIVYQQPVPLGQRSVMFEVTSDRFSYGSFPYYLYIEHDNNITWVWAGPVTVERINDKPLVVIRNCPSDGTTNSAYTFRWSGFDPDGSVAGYYYSLDNPTPSEWTTSMFQEYTELSDGPHTFYIRARDDAGEYSDVASCNFEVNPRKMKAVIIAGGGPTNEPAKWYNGIWKATENNADIVYNTLIHQGFADEDIYYLSADALNNSYADADATLENLKEALETWAQDADSLTLCMIDHGGEDKFRMNRNEILSVSDLDLWLDDLQENICDEVTVVYDACFAETFIPHLTPPNGKKRTVIASSFSDENAWFASKGVISFSNYFWMHIFKGDDIRDAFEAANTAMGTSIGVQHPVVDANGNGIGNEDGEADLLQNFYIGNGTLNPANPPDMTGISPPQTVNGNSALLFASGVTDDEGVDRVWALILPPGYTPVSPDKPVMEVSSLELLPVGNDRYENTYNAFHREGTYRIAIFATDVIGNVSDPQVTTVKVISTLKQKAVIVVGDHDFHDFWFVAEHNAIFAYEVLKHHGYTDEDIYLISPPAFSSVAADALPEIDSFREAVENWGGQSSWDILIYMIGKDDQEGNFRLNETEILEPEILKGWLDNLQINLPGAVTVIYDACSSGDFLSSLTASEDKKRILISSTSGDGCPAFPADGTLSFSSFFWQGTAIGMNIRDAFIWAQQAVKYLGRCSGEEQMPALDDNGNGIFNEKSDGRLARDHTLGSGVVLDMNIPVIGSVSPYQTLNGETSAAISAENVTATGTIDKVLAVIVPPGGMPSGTTELPTVELLPVGNGRYEGIYQDFTRKGIYRISVYATETDGDISQPQITEIEQTVGTEEPAFSGGVFTAGDSGIIQAEYWYDGGSYEGELGIFSLAGLEEFTPGSPEFIKEAARRAKSNTPEGYIIISDHSESGRFDGASVLVQNRKSGWFKGRKRFAMNAGERFAIMLVPGSTIESLYQNPGTVDSLKRPLFSLASLNPAYGMNMGQIADVDGRGGAFVFEDMEISRSDQDYNDLIFRITGASADNIPSMDSLLTGDMPDWRKDTELGQLIMTHLEMSKPDMPRLSVTMSGTADLLAYDSAGNVIGKEGGNIPGSLFGIDEQEYRFVCLPLSEDGADAYRLVIRSAVPQTCELTATTYVGDTEISSENFIVAIDAHQVFKADVPVLAFGDEPSAEVGEFDIPADADGNPLFYDFEGDGDIDDEDIGRVHSLWNICEGDPLFDAFYDLDDDGCITVLDIMPVVNNKHVP